MRFGYLFTAAVVGGAVSFGWGAVSHLALNLEGREFKSFADSNAVVQTVKANAPENGVYFDGRGLFAAVSFRQDLGNRFEAPLEYYIRQFLVCLAVALVLAWVLLRLPPMTALQTGILFGIVALAAGIEQLVPMHIWYGFPRSMVAARGFDVIVGWFLIGLVLGGLRGRLAPVAAAG
jgi:hypothetical protein